MSAAIALRNIVRVAEHVLLITIIPLQRRLDKHAVPFRLKMQNPIMNWCLVAVEVLDEGLNPTVVFENIFFVFSFVDQTDAYPRIQERKLS